MWTINWIKTWLFLSWDVGEGPTLKPKGPWLTLWFYATCWSWIDERWATIPQWCHKVWVMISHLQFPPSLYKKVKEKRWTIWDLIKTFESWNLFLQRNYYKTSWLESTTWLMDPLFWWNLCWGFKIITPHLDLTQTKQYWTNDIPNYPKVLHSSHSLFLVCYC